MPRQARLDTPGLVHPLMARRLNRGRIFADDVDREARARALRRSGVSVRDLAKRVAKAADISGRDLFLRTRRRGPPAAKAALILAAVEVLGETLISMAAITQMSLSGAARAWNRLRALQSRFGLKRLTSTRNRAA